MIYVRFTYGLESDDTKMKLSDDFKDLDTLTKLDILQDCLKMTETEYNNIYDKYIKDND
jgi:hypothetical protein